MQREMPKYQCHKKVWALKIKSILFTSDDPSNFEAEITPEEDGYGPFMVDNAYLSKHKPPVVPLSSTCG